jgi:putative spermidine/putrescine transport system ATP-binding protein
MSRVSLRQVTRRFGAVTALHPTDLDVTEGEFLTLLGPSGCGKTTTLRILAGFVPPTAGRVLIGDDDVTRVPPNRRQIGMVFQDYALFPHLTVGENIAFALRERRVPKGMVTARVAEMLDLIHLPDVAARYPAQLSGGQQQRVALARAIAYPPRVLLMDEPFGALDQKLREVMQVELRRIQQALGITTIFVTHDQGEAMNLSDTIAVMCEGRVVQRGTPQEIYQHPSSRFVADFIGQINFIEATVLGRHETGCDGTWDVAQAEEARFLVPPGALGRVTLGVRPHQISVDADARGNRISGRVLSTSFGGNICRMRVQVADTEWIVEANPNAPAHPDGSIIVLTWPPEQTVVLRG